MLKVLGRMDNRVRLAVVYFIVGVGQVFKHLLQQNVYEIIPSRLFTASMISVEIVFLAMYAGLICLFFMLVRPNRDYARFFVNFYT